MEIKKIIGLVVLGITVLLIARWVRLAYKLKGKQISMPEYVVQTGLIIIFLILFLSAVAFGGMLLL